MKYFILVLFNILLVSVSFGQNADELNVKSKNLIQQGKYKEAFPILLQSAELGNGEAQYNLAYFLQNGIDGIVDEQEAIKWFLKSSENGFNNGHYAMMMAYANGQGVDQNSEKAFEYALKCASNDDATCMWNVANCYLTGNGVPINETKFKEWIIRLAKLPNPENITISINITSARLEIANFYKNGKYFDKDNYQSYLWYIAYNESKADFSVFKQNEVILEIKEVEQQLSKQQRECALKDAEILLGRTLNKLNELYNISM